MMIRQAYQIGSIECDTQPNHPSISINKQGLAAAIAPGQCLVERCGTPFYMAVEMINKQPYDQV